MSKLKQTKIPVSIADTKWELIREKDQLTKHSNEVGFIEWNDDGTFKELYRGTEGIAIGRSLMLGPFNPSFVWQTTEILDFHVREEGGWYITTKNSNYILTEIVNNFSK